MIEGIYLRLAGVLQSWAGQALAGNIVHTERFPTHSGLKGLIAGALGAPRGQWPAWLEDVEFTVRQDRRPRVVDDFHTINPRTESEEFRSRLLLAHGDRATGKNLVFTPDAQGTTAVVNRTYLADGEFLVRVVCDNHLDELETALGSPGFSTYLGRKAFPPAFPFYLGRGSIDCFEQIPTVNWQEKQHGYFRRSRAEENTNTSETPELSFESAVPQRTTPLIFVEYSRYTNRNGKRKQCAVPVAPDEDSRLEAIFELLAIRRKSDSN